jgi:uncharacterized protein
MSLLVNIRHLTEHELDLCGELSANELDLDTQDEMIKVDGPVRYVLEVQRLDQSLLIQGDLRVKLACQCVRCLKPFQRDLELLKWICHLSLEGDEKVAVVNDCVDLTPYVREDILLELPQHPLCRPECRGLKQKLDSKKKLAGGRRASGSPEWAALKKLKL